MAIYRLSEIAEEQRRAKVKEEVEEPVSEHPVQKREQFFSALTARLFFSVLLTFCGLWVVYAFISLLISSVLRLVTVSKFSKFLQWNQRSLISLRRSSVCSVSLGIALVSPSFGIMVACTYFFTYDQEGIDEVIPASLQGQFHLNKDRLHSSRT